jgi:hypothetical protein
MFLSCKKGTQFSSQNEPSLRRLNIRFNILGCALGYGIPLRRRQSKLTPVPLLENRKDYQVTLTVQL